MYSVYYQSNYAAYRELPNLDRFFLGLFESLYLAKGIFRHPLVLPSLVYLSTAEMNPENLVPAVSRFIIICKVGNKTELCIIYHDIRSKLNVNTTGTAWLEARS